MDVNGNGVCSLAEIDKWVVERWPVLNNKPALMRAYHATIDRDDSEADAWVVSVFPYYYFYSRSHPKQQHAEIRTSPSSTRCS